jgi:[acyl-carrier-protein] S-malonyltransferase
MAGLSSGEWTALHLAGVVAYEDVLRVLAARGKFMQEACLEQKGGMLSVIGMARETLEEIAADTGVELANFNSSQQIVLSGPVDNIEKATEEVKAAGAKRAIPLQVAGAFHSSLMNSAAERLKPVLDDIVFEKPLLPVLSNVTGRPHETPDSIRSNMVAQVNSSVEWAASIAWMQGQGIDTFVECGPGRVLTGLVKRIDKQASLLNIQGVNDLNTLNDD